MNHLVWLASYPKSGNTWVRAIITALRRPNDQTLDLHGLIGGDSARDPGLFEDMIGLRFSELPAEEAGGLLPLFVAHLAEQARGVEYRKTHDCFAPPPACAPLFSGAMGARALYVVRDPRDVAVSFAHHRGVDIDEILDVMEDPSATTIRAGGDVVEHLGAWSDHVAGWLTQQQIPVRLIRFEDLVRRPLRTACGALGFSGEPYSVESAARAVAAAQFGALRAIEEETGFGERSTRAERFFRSGRTGDWKAALSTDQARRIERRHGHMMRRLGYPAGPGREFCPG